MSTLAKAKRRLTYFTGKEYVTVMVLAAVFALALVFRDLFATEVTFELVIADFVFLFLGMFLAVWMHEAGHKLAGAVQGYRVEPETNNTGVVLSLLVLVYTQGLIPLVTPNALKVDSVPRLRVNKFYRYENPRHVGYIAMGGILGSMLAICVFNILASLTTLAIFKTIAFGAIMHAFYSFVPFELLNILSLRYFNKIDPITPGDGMHLWVASAVRYLGTLILLGLFVLLAVSFTVANWIFLVVLLVIFGVLFSNLNS